MMEPIRTDLAMEAREARGEMHGVTVEEATLCGMTITRVRVMDEEGANTIGKPVGTYVTIECAGLSQREAEHQRVLHESIAREIAAMLPKKENLKALIVGLGNRYLTPDSLGPRTTERVLVTRHLLTHLPDSVDGRLRDVCAISPGVLGITGVETGEIVKGVVERIHPDVVLCIDSLAARRTSRILTTVQLADTGVQPGSGVGNARREISSHTLGVPVIAIGVPMVVHASTITHDAVESLLSALKNVSGEGTQIYELLMSFGDDGLREALAQTQPPEMEGLIVTPSVIDDAVEAVASAVATGINMALHPDVAEDELGALLA